MPPLGMRRLEALHPCVLCLLIFTSQALTIQKILSGGARSVSFTSACEGLKIGVLDLGSFAEPSQVSKLCDIVSTFSSSIRRYKHIYYCQARVQSCIVSEHATAVQAKNTNGLQECSLDSLVVDPTNGVVYDKDLMSYELPWAVVPHHYGTHSQPWFLEQAIRKSLHFTEDVEEADIIFVADYCYYIKWLAHMHTLGAVPDDGQGPGDVLVELYDRMLASPRWQRHWGSGYAFFDGHSGFQTGKAVGPYDERVRSLPPYITNH